MARLGRLSMERAPLRVSVTLVVLGVGWVVGGVRIALAAAPGWARYAELTRGCTVGLLMVAVGMSLLFGRARPLGGRRVPIHGTGPAGVPSYWRPRRPAPLLVRVAATISVAVVTSTAAAQLATDPAAGVLERADRVSGVLMTTTLAVCLVLVYRGPLTRPPLSGDATRT